MQREIANKLTIKIQCVKKVKQIKEIILHCKTLSKTEGKPWHL